MAELAQRLGLDLSDTLPGDREPPADLLQGVLTLLADAETQAEDLLLLGRERRQCALDLRHQVLADQAIVGRVGALVFQEVAELRILADRRLERERLARGLQDQADLLRRHARALG